MRADKKEKSVWRQMLHGFQEPARYEYRPKHFSEQLRGGMRPAQQMLALLLVFAMVVTVIPETTMRILADAGKPVVISSMQDFEECLLDSGHERYNPNGRYVLDTDLDFTGTDFAPVGTQDKPFTGSLDGSGYLVEGLDHPLFGFVEKASLKNLTLQGDVEKPFTFGASKSYVDAYALLAAYAKDTAIKYCSANGTIKLAQPVETEILAPAVADAGTESHASSGNVSAESSSPQEDSGKSSSSEAPSGDETPQLPESSSPSSSDAVISSVPEDSSQPAEPDKQDAQASQPTEPEAPVGSSRPEESSAINNAVESQGVQEIQESAGSALRHNTNVSSGEAGGAPEASSEKTEESEEPPEAPSSEQSAEPSSSGQPSDPESSQESAADSSDPDGTSHEVSGQEPESSEPTSADPSVGGADPAESSQPESGNQPGADVGAADQNSSQVETVVELPPAEVKTLTVTAGRAIAGGLVAYSENTNIILSYAHVSVQEDCGVPYTLGGLAGVLFGDSLIDNSYATGLLQAKTEPDGTVTGVVGGLAGRAEGAVQNSFYTGTVKAPQKAESGPVTGKKYDGFRAENTAYDRQMSLVQDADESVKGLLAVNLTTKTMPEGLSGNWRLIAGSYPQIAAFANDTEQRGEIMQYSAVSAIALYFSSAEDTIASMHNYLTLPQEIDGAPISWDVNTADFTVIEDKVVPVEVWGESDPRMLRSAFSLTEEPEPEEQASLTATLSGTELSKTFGIGSISTKLVTSIETAPEVRLGDENNKNMDTCVTFTALPDDEGVKAQYGYLAAVDSAPETVSWDDITWSENTTLTGLHRNTRYWFYAGYPATEESSGAISPAAEMITALTPLTSAQISGTPAVGCTLTGSFEPKEAEQETGAVSYRWSVSDELLGPYTILSGSTTTECKLSPTEYNKYVKFTVIANANSDYIDSSESTVVGPVAKGEQKTPADPVVTERTYTTILLAEVAGAEYSNDGGETWQNTPLFEDLESGKEYGFIQRLKETSYYNASPATKEVRAVTMSAPGAPEVTAGSAGFVVGGTLTATIPTGESGILRWISCDTDNPSIDAWNEITSGVSGDKKTLSIGVGLYNKYVRVEFINSDPDYTGAAYSPARLITEAEQAKPTASVLSSAAVNAGTASNAAYITVTTQANLEYAVLSATDVPESEAADYAKNAEWKTANAGSSLKFSGLSQKTSYYLYARVAAKTGYNPSPVIYKKMTVATIQVGGTIQVVGEVAVGSSVTVAIDGAEGQTGTWQWWVFNTASKAWEKISGAVGNVFSFTSSYLGKLVKAVYSGNGDYSGDLERMLGVVQVTVSKPAYGSVPRYSSGDPVHMNMPLTASLPSELSLSNVQNAVGSGKTAAIVYQWQSCATIDGIYQDLTAADAVSAGSKTSVYKPVPVDGGNYVRCKVTVQYTQSGKVTEIGSAVSESTLIDKRLFDIGAADDWVRCFANNKYYNNKIYNYQYVDINFTKDFSFTESVPNYKSAYSSNAIGNAVFYGNVYGNGHTLSGVNKQLIYQITTTDPTYQKRMSISDLTVVQSTFGIHENTSALLAYTVNYTDVEDCHAVWNTSVTITKPSSYFGGLIASITQGRLKNCTVTGGATITLAANVSYAGGLLAYGSTNNNYGYIDNCWADISLVCNGTGNGFIGGLIGYAGRNGSWQGYYVRNCAALGNVTGAVNSGIGGLIGFASSTTYIQYSYAAGVVTGSGSGEIGAMVGRAVDMVSNQPHYSSYTKSYARQQGDLPALGDDTRTGVSLLAPDAMKTGGAETFDGFTSPPWNFRSATELPLPDGAQASSATAVSILNKPLVGNELQALTDPASAAVSSYQWERGNTLDGSYTAILGAAKQFYTVTSADDGKFLRVTVVIGGQSLSSKPVPGGNKVTISSAAEWRNYLYDNYDTFMNCDIELGADITFDNKSGSTTSQPTIASSTTKKFHGSFDGKGHTITNVRTPLIYYMEGTNGANLSFKNVNIVTESSTTCSNAPVSWQANYVDYANVHVTLQNTVTGSYYIGGIVGYLSYGNMVSCSVHAINDTIMVKASSNVNPGYMAGYCGGLVGNGSVYVMEECWADVDVDSPYGVGGLAGVITNVRSLKNCYATGDVNARNQNDKGETTGANAGALVGSLGYNSNTIKPFLQNCYATGKVTVTLEDNNVGAFLGWLSATKPIDDYISGCYYLNHSDGRTVVGAGPINNYGTPTQIKALTESQMKPSGASSTAYTNWKTPPWRFRSGYYPDLEGANSSVTDVAISGTPKVGQVLKMASVTPSAASGSLTYQWIISPDMQTGENISGATSSSYTIKPDDVGKFLRLTVTGTGNYGGTASSAFTTVVLKGDQSVPTAPKVAQRATNLNITATQGYEYAVRTSKATPAESEWVNPKLDTGEIYVVPGSYGTTYYVYARKAGTYAYNASAASSPTTIKVELPTLDGVVGFTGMVDGKPAVGVKMTAAFYSNDGSTITGTGSWVWKRGSTTVSTSNTYTPTLSDVGQTLTATFTSTGYQGSGVGTTAAVAPVKITGGLTLSYTGQNIPTFSKKITASYTGSESGLAGTWAWYRGSVAAANKVGSAAAYTPIAADIGSTLTVVFTASSPYTGQLETSTVAVSRLTQTVPAAPTITLGDSAGENKDTVAQLNTVSSANGVAPKYGFRPASSGAATQWGDITWGDSNVITGLTRNTSYLFYIGYPETATVYSAISPATNQKTEPSHIHAVDIESASATGDPSIGATLTAQSAPPSAITDKAVLIQWMVCDTKDGEYTEIPGAVNADFIPSRSYISKYVKIKLTANTEDYTGSVYSDPIGPIGKGDQLSVPPAPAMDQRTLTTVALAVVEECEYSIDGAHWQDSPLFSGLKAGTSYQFFQRYRESEYYRPSAVTSAIFSTRRSPGKPELTPEAGKTAAVDITITAVRPQSELGNLRWLSCETDSPSSEDWSEIPSSAISGDTFTPDVNYYQKYIRVEFENVSADYDGVSYSDSLLISEGSQAAPAVPVLTVDGDSKITTTVVVNAQYAIVSAGKPGQSSVPSDDALANLEWISPDSAAVAAGKYDFTGLSRNTVYYIYARYPAKYGYNASPLVNATSNTQKTEIGGTIQITGELSVGSMVHAEVLNGKEGQTGAWQWQMWNNATQAWENIKDAIGEYFTITLAQAGKQLRAVFTATGDFTGSVEGAEPDGQGYVPIPVKEVAINGTPVIAETLTAVVKPANGSTVPEEDYATAFTYQWARGDASNGPFTDLPGETNRTYSPVADDDNKFLRVTVKTVEGKGYNGGGDSIPIIIGKATLSIRSAADWNKYFGTQEKQDIYRTSNINILKDFSFSSEAQALPLGTSSSKPFLGNLNSNGFNVSGVTIPLIGYMGNGDAENQPSVREVYLSGTLTNSYKETTGGMLVASGSSVVIDNCYVLVTEAVTYTAGNAGIMFGKLDNATVTRCQAETAQDISFRVPQKIVGGMVYQSQSGSSFTQCGVNAAIENGSVFGGRLLDTAVNNCYAEGSIGSGSQKCGFAYLASGTLTNSYCAVSGATAIFSSGGFDGTVTNFYYDMERFTGSASGLTGMTTSKMQEGVGANFTGFTTPPWYYSYGEYPNFTPRTPMEATTVSGASNGNIRVDETLTRASFTPADASTICQWQKSTDGGETFDDIPDADSPSYTVLPQDINSIIRLRVSGTRMFSGTVYSDTYTVIKGVTKAPSKPAFEVKNVIEIVTATVRGQEYAVVEGKNAQAPTSDDAWYYASENGTYTVQGEALKTYTVFTRIAETAAYLASPATAADAVTLPLLPITGVVTVNGKAAVGSVLNASLSNTNIPPILTQEEVGSWSWEKYNAATKAWAAIAGADTASYTPVVKDAGQKIRAVFTAKSPMEGSLNKEVEVDRFKITGTVVYSYQDNTGAAATSPVYKGAVTASYQGTEPDVTGEWKWYRGEISEANQILDKDNKPVTTASYTPAEADVGAVLIAVFSAYTPYIGDVSTTTSQVARAVQDVPEAPEVTGGDAQGKNKDTMATVTAIAAANNVKAQYGYRLTSQGAASKWSDVTWSESNEVSGLNRNTEYDIYVGYPASQYYYEAMSAGVHLKTERTPLTKIEITGTPELNKTLTANIAPADATVTYQWLRDGEEILGQTIKTYTLREADVGKKISVSATASGDFSGEVTSTQTDAVAKAPTAVTPVKANTTAVEDLKITIAAKAGQEYLVKTENAAPVESEWTGSLYYKAQSDGDHDFALSRNTEYWVFTRVAENDYYLASDLAETLTVKTLKTELSGSVTLTGTVKVDETITAAIPSTNGQTGAWSWSVDGTEAAPNASEDMYTSTYTIKPADTGKVITAKFTASGSFQGEKSASSQKVANAKKADPQQVVLIAGETDGDTTLAFTAEKGVSYLWKTEKTAPAIDDAAWVTPEKEGKYNITGLKRNTEYYLYAVRKAELGYDASEIVLAGQAATEIRVIGGTNQMTGVVLVGKQLKAGLPKDKNLPDDLTGTWTWWMKDTENGEWSQIPDAAGETYTVPVADAGKWIKAVFAPTPDTGFEVDKNDPVQCVWTQAASKQLMSGTVSYSYEEGFSSATFQSAITASYTLGGDEDDLSAEWFWYRGEINSGSQIKDAEGNPVKGNTYTPRAVDVGKVLIAAYTPVEGSRFAGLASAETAAVARASQTAPAAPDAAAMKTTDTKIIVEPADASLQYAASKTAAAPTEESAWFSPADGKCTITGLERNTPYYVFARKAALTEEVAGTAVVTTNPSPASGGTQISTKNYVDSGKLTLAIHANGVPADGVVLDIAAQYGKLPSGAVISIPADSLPALSNEAAKFISASSFLSASGAQQTNVYQQGSNWANVNFGYLVEQLDASGNTLDKIESTADGTPSGTMTLNARAVSLKFSIYHANAVSSLGEDPSVVFHLQAGDTDVAYRSDLSLSTQLNVVAPIKVAEMRLAPAENNQGVINQSGGISFINNSPLPISLKAEDYAAPGSRDILWPGLEAKPDGGLPDNANVPVLSGSGSYTGPQQASLGLYSIDPRTNDEKDLKVWFRSTGQDTDTIKELGTLANGSDSRYKLKGVYDLRFSWFQGSDTYDGWAIDNAYQFCFIWGISPTPAE